MTDTLISNITIISPIENKLLLLSPIRETPSFLLFSPLIRLVYFTVDHSHTGFQVPATVRTGIFGNDAGTSRIPPFGLKEGKTLQKDSVVALSETGGGKNTADLIRRGNFNVLVRFVMISALTVSYSGTVFQGRGHGALD